MVQGIGESSLGQRPVKEAIPEGYMVVSRWLALERRTYGTR